MRGLGRSALGVAWRFRRAVEDRGACFGAWTPAHTAEPIVLAGRELLSRFLLLGGKDVHGEAASSFNFVQA